jgi:hypothetical protein
MIIKRTFILQNGEYVNKLLIVLLILSSSLLAQSEPKTGAAQTPSADYSGMYSFLQEGEFVQLTVEDHGLVTGFVSRYKEGEGTNRTFVDHFFKQGKLDGKKLTFTTEIAQNTSYEFQGTIERGDGKKPEDEAYYVVKGELTQYTIESDKKTTSKTESVAFKSFPQDADVDSPPVK